jgi:hypothetical protein
MVYTRVAPDDQLAWLRVIGSLWQCAKGESDDRAVDRATVAAAFHATR